ncbi:MAG: hypothetical protein M3065_08615 [Actinomycetota bacterium]|nr:hypothetical protein [Actinomycetota bacterium]
MDLEQQLIGGGDRLGAHIVLADPRQPRVGQRGDPGVRDVFDATADFEHAIA